MQCNGAMNTMVDWYNVLINHKKNIMCDLTIVILENHCIYKLCNIEICVGFWLHDTK